MVITLDEISPSLPMHPSEKVAQADSQSVKNPGKRKNGGNGNGKRPNGNQAIVKIDIAEACKLRFDDGKTEQEIADVFGVSQQAVNKGLQKFTRMFGNPQELKAFNAFRVMAWNNLEHLAIDQAVVKIDDTSAGEAMRIAKEAHAVGRLESNQSTSNIAIDIRTSEGFEVARAAAEAVIKGMVEDSYNKELEAVKGVSDET